MLSETHFCERIFNDAYFKAWLHNDESSLSTEDFTILETYAAS